MVRRAERPLGDERLAVGEQSHHAVHGRGLQGFLEGQIRLDGGNPLGQHRLAGARRADQEHVVRARHGDLKGSFGQALAFDLGKIHPLGVRALPQRRRPLGTGANRRGS